MCVYNSCDLGDDTICDGLCHFGAVELLKQLQCKEQTISSILELAEENKNTLQYQGICKSILDTIKQIKGE